MYKTSPSTKPNKILKVDMVLEVKKCIAFIDLQLPKNKMKMLKSIVYETLSDLQTMS